MLPTVPDLTAATDIMLATAEIQEKVEAMVAEKALSMKTLPMAVIHKIKVTANATALIPKPV
jgi:hypothetical protein